jgi:hypothetical protein
MLRKGHPVRNSLHQAWLEFSPFHAQSARLCQVADTNIILAAKCCNTVPIFSWATTIKEAAAFSVTAAVGILSHSQQVGRQYYSKKLPHRMTWEDIGKMKTKDFSQRHYNLREPPRPARNKQTEPNTDR